VRWLRQKKDRRPPQSARRDRLLQLSTTTENESKMSLGELHDRIRSYESLLDRLVAANNTERAGLLEDYNDRRKGTSIEPNSEGLDNDHGLSQVNGTTKLPSRFGASNHEDQDTTLTVLGCGVFSLSNMLLSPH
jgi:hypothetical protein